MVVSQDLRYLFEGPSAILLFGSLYCPPPPPPPPPTLLGNYENSCVLQWCSQPLNMQSLILIPSLLGFRVGGFGLHHPQKMKDDSYWDYDGDPEISPSFMGSPSTPPYTPGGRVAVGPGFFACRMC